MNRVIHFEIQADDPARAQAFYEKALGWKITPAMKKEDGGMMDYWSLDTGEGSGIGGGMYLRPKEAKDQKHLFDCTVLVEDIDTVTEAVVGSGGVLTGEKFEVPKIGTFVGIKDTEGNTFTLMQASSEWQPK